MATGSHGIILKLGKICAQKKRTGPEKGGRGSGGKGGNASPRSRDYRGIRSQVMGKLSNPKAHLSESGGKLRTNDMN